MRIRGWCGGLVVLGALTGAAPAVAQDCATQNPCRFTQPGSTGTYVVPEGVTSLDVLLAGGRGGTGSLYAGGRNDRCPVTRPECSALRGAGGRGALLRARIPVSVGQTLFVDVAGDARANSGGRSGNPGSTVYATGGTADLGGGGGGASAIRTSDVVPSVGRDPRLIVAGGGGGGGGAALRDGTPAVTSPGFPGGDAGQPGKPGAVDLGFLKGPILGGEPGTAMTPGRSPVLGDLRPGSNGTINQGGSVVFEQRSTFWLGGAGGAGLRGGGAGGLRVPLSDSLPLSGTQGGGGGGSSGVSAGGTVQSIGTNEGTPFVSIAFGGADPAGPSQLRDDTSYELLLDGKAVGRATSMEVTTGAESVGRGESVRGTRRAATTAARSDQRKITFGAVRTIGPRLVELDRARGQVVLPGAVVVLRNPRRPTVSQCLSGLHGPDGGGTLRGGVYSAYSFRYERVQTCAGAPSQVPPVTAEVLVRSSTAVLRVSCLQPAPCNGTAVVRPPDGKEVQAFSLAAQREQTFVLAAGPTASQFSTGKVTVSAGKGAPQVTRSIGDPTSGLNPRPMLSFATPLQVVRAIAQTEAPPGAPPAFVPPPTPPAPTTPPPPPPTTTTGTTTTPEPTPEPTSTTITCAGPTPAGSDAVFSGGLAPAAEGQLVRVTYRLDGRDPIVREVRTASDGRWTDTFRAPAAGTWRVQAVHPGTATRAPSTSPTCEHRAQVVVGAMTIECPPLGRRDQPAPVSGRLTGAPAGSSVVLTYRVDRSVHTSSTTPDEVHEVTTDTDGHWSDETFVSGNDREPFWTVTARFAGDPQRAPAEATCAFERS